MGCANQYIGTRYAGLFFNQFFGLQDLRLRNAAQIKRDENDFSAVAFDDHRVAEQIVFHVCADAVMEIAVEADADRRRDAMAGGARLEIRKTFRVEELHGFSFCYWFVFCKSYERYEAQNGNYKTSHKIINLEFPELWKF